MKKLLLISLLVGALPLSMAAQDDLYFQPKPKKGAVENVTDRNGMPRDTYYVGSNRSIDDYNRRLSRVEVIDSDSIASDIIVFNGEKGVYPDSLQTEDYELTKKLSRFDDYTIDEKTAYWRGYRDGRYDWSWHSPWYYGRYGWGWYDPFFFVTDHFYYDPWYYGWHGYDYYGYYGWWYGWYDPWYSHYWGWNPWYNGYYYGYYFGGGGGSRHYAGSIHRHSGTMSGRNYGRGSGTSIAGRIGGNSRLGSSRSTSLHNRRVAGHVSYSNGNSNYSDGGGSAFNNSSSASGGYGGGASSAASSARSSGGGGARSGGGHVGGRR